MSYVECYILESFIFSEDGYTETPAPKGATVQIPERLFAGLNDARKVRRAKIGDGRITLQPAAIPSDVQHPTSGDISLPTLADAPSGMVVVEANNGPARVNTPAPQPPSRTAELSEAEEAALADGSWKGLKFFAKRSIAAKLSSDPITNGEQADAAIEAELERRGRKE